MKLMDEGGLEENALPALLEVMIPVRLKEPKKYFEENQGSLTKFKKKLKGDAVNRLSISCCPILYPIIISYHVILYHIMS